MERANSQFSDELAIIEEDDEFYEGIEAPKFVDFTVPDRSRPDDKSWFCVRIGCDQQHDEVDHDALYRNFVIRVMAARSPNVKIQRALNRQAPRSIRRSPCSAPAKSAKDRVSRLSTLTSIPDQLAKTRLRKDHPISSLRSTPKQTKAVVQPISSSNKKALTTPRTKKCSTNHEPFRSVMHQKALVSGVKNKNVTKVLFLHTPKKTTGTNHSTIPDVSDGIKKLNIGSLKKHTPGGNLCKSSRCDACDPIYSENSLKKPEEISFSSKKKIEFSSLEAVHSKPQHSELDDTLSNRSVLSTNTEERVLFSLVSSTEGSTLAGPIYNNSNKQCDTNKVSEGNALAEQVSMGEATETEIVDAVSEENAQVDQDSRAEGFGTVIVDGVHDLDNDKENASSTCATSNMDSSITENENLQIETCENIPQKFTRIPRKIVQDHHVQGGKPKRTTNPKPFRLRTDERGILKEANLERKLKLEAQKETASAIRHEEGKQQNGRPAQEQDIQTVVTKEAHTAQTNRARTPRSKRVRFVEARYANINPKYQKPENKKATEELKSSSRQLPKTQSESARTVSVSRLREKVALNRDVKAKNNIMANAICSKGRKPATISKDPNFSRLPLPTNCGRRPEIV